MAFPGHESQPRIFPGIRVKQKETHRVWQLTDVSEPNKPTEMHRDAILPLPAVLQPRLELSGPLGEERDVAVVESVPLSSDPHKKPADHSGWKG